MSRIPMIQASNFEGYDKKDIQNIKYTYNYCTFATMFRNVKRKENNYKLTLFSMYSE